MIKNFNDYMIVVTLLILVLITGIFTIGSNQIGALVVIIMGAVVMCVPGWYMRNDKSNPKPIVYIGAPVLYYMLAKLYRGLTDDGILLVFRNGVVVVGLFVLVGLVFLHQSTAILKGKPEGRLPRRFFSFMMGIVIVVFLVSSIEHLVAVSQIFSAKQMWRLLEVPVLPIFLLAIITGMAHRRGANILFVIIVCVILGYILAPFSVDYIFGGGSLAGKGGVFLGAERYRFTITLGLISNAAYFLISSWVGKRDDD